MMSGAQPQGYHPDYAQLTAYLKRRRRRQITLSFTELEQSILLGPLPYGARAQASWWSNTPSRMMHQNRGWLDAGWRVAARDQLAETVTFERSEG